MAAVRPTAGKVVWRAPVAIIALVAFTQATARTARDGDEYVDVTGGNFLLDVAVMIVVSLPYVLGRHTLRENVRRFLTSLLVATGTYAVALVGDARAGLSGLELLAGDRAASNPALAIGVLFILLPLLGWAMGARAILPTVMAFLACGAVEQAIRFEDVADGVSRFGEDFSPYQGARLLSVFAIGLVGVGALVGTLRDEKRSVHE